MNDIDNSKVLSDDLKLFTVLADRHQPIPSILQGHFWLLILLFH